MAYQTSRKERFMFFRFHKAVLMYDLHIEMLKYGVFLRNILYLNGEKSNIENEKHDCK